MCRSSVSISVTPTDARLVPGVSFPGGGRKSVRPSRKVTERQAERAGVQGEHILLWGVFNVLLMCHEELPPAVWRMVAFLLSAGGGIPLPLRETYVHIKAAYGNWILTLILCSRCVQWHGTFSFKENVCLPAQVNIKGNSAAHELFLLTRLSSDLYSTTGLTGTHSNHKQIWRNTSVEYQLHDVEILFVSGLSVVIWKETGHFTRYKPRDIHAHTDTQEIIILWTSKVWVDESEENKWRHI